MINGSNSGWNNSYPVNAGYSSVGGYSFSGAYANAGYIQQPKIPTQPKIDTLWCLPIQNFRIDGGSTNLYSQKVSIDWPEFRPQSPIFSGTKVKQDTTNIYADHGYNYNFEDCYSFGNGTQGMIDQLVPSFYGVSQNYTNPYPYIDYSYGGMSAK